MYDKRRYKYFSKRTQKQFAKDALRCFNWPVVPEGNGWFIVKLDEIDWKYYKFNFNLKNEAWKYRAELLKNGYSEDDFVDSPLKCTLYNPIDTAG